jgi:hypothetical protein
MNLFIFTAIPDSDGFPTRQDLEYGGQINKIFNLLQAIKI